MSKPPREKEPPINPGDEIFIGQGGGAGRWMVRAARYERRSADEADGHRISLVLSKGSQSFKTYFNAKTMRHISNTPAYMLSRDIHVPKQIRVKGRNNNQPKNKP